MMSRLKTAGPPLPLPSTKRNIEHVATCIDISIPRCRAECNVSLNILVLDSLICLSTIILHLLQT